MKQKVLIDVDVLENLICFASDAYSLLDDVHCYDTEVYENLSDALNAIEYEVVEGHTKKRFYSVSY